MFPAQVEFNIYGYIFLLVIFFVSFISLVSGERKMNEDARSGVPFKICVSLVAVMVFLAGYDEFMNATHYVKIYHEYIPLFELCFLLLFGFILYSFAITVGWSFYKFKFEHEVTPFLYRIIKFADFIKRETGL